MNCTQCGTPALREDARWCSACGRALTAPPGDITGLERPIPGPEAPVLGSIPNPSPQEWSGSPNAQDPSTSASQTGGKPYEISSSSSSWVRSPPDENPSPGYPSYNQPGGAPRSGGNGKVIAFLGSIVIVGAIVAAIASNKSDNSSTQASPTDATSFDAPSSTTARDDCATEVNIAIDVTLNVSSGALGQAIGYQNAIMAVVDGQGVYGNFLSNESAQGVSYAESKVIQDAATGCAAAGDPLLTPGQVQSLTQVATGTDVTALQAVTHFAP